MFPAGNAAVTVRMFPTENIEELGLDPPGLEPGREEL